jgi:2-iminobutanoate/2-iminopropanoate deaminase
MKQIIETKNAPAAVGPYSQGVKVGNILFVSGQIHNDPATGKMVEGDIKVKFKRVMENITAILKEAGLSVDNVVKVSIFLADFNDFKAMNEEYAKIFTAKHPARETVQVAGLPLGADIEVSCIAMSG